jgi:hypothetical protein
MDSLISNEAFSNAKNDSLKWISMFIIARLISNQSLESLQNHEWIKSSLLMVIGVIAYWILVHRLISENSTVSGDLRKALHDVIYFGTILVVARLLSGKPLNDVEWMKETSYWLIGFCAYSIITSKFVDTSKFSKNTKASAVDIMKWGTMFIVSQWLANKPFNQEWGMKALSWTAGFAIYDVLIMR